MSKTIFDRSHSSSLNFSQRIHFQIFAEVHIKFVPIFLNKFNAIKWPYLSCFLIEIQLKRQRTSYKNIQFIEQSIIFEKKRSKKNGVNRNYRLNIFESVQIGEYGIFWPIKQCKNILKNQNFHINIEYASMQTFIKYKVQITELQLYNVHVLTNVVIPHPI